MLISHHKKPLIEPYNFLEEKLEEVCKANDLILIQKTSDEFGINIIERFLCIYKTILFIFLGSLNGSPPDGTKPPPFFGGFVGGLPPPIPDAINTMLLP